MTLERLVEEVRRQAAEDLEKERRRYAAAAEELLATRASTLAEISESSERQLAQESARIRGATLARAKVDGRRRLFEARQRAAERLLAQARDRLEGFTETDGYSAVLKRLLRSANDRLGKQIRVRGRAEDAELLRAIAGKSFVAEPIPIEGGLVAETADGARRLDYSFGELLRRREAEVLELARAGESRG